MQSVMQSFTTHTGVAAPLDRANVDTDQIIPKQFMKRIERTGYGPFAFFDWRYLGNGDDMRPNPDFELNAPVYKNASVLVTGKNFGCGSSREHAPWALGEYGFRSILAPSFADIFYNNCFKNGMLPVVLPESVIAALIARLQANPGAMLTVDLMRGVVTGASIGFEQSFAVDAFRRECLLNGWDDIALTLRHASAIDEFEKRRIGTVAAV